MIIEDIKKRKGPRTAKDISPDVRKLLNTGRIPTVNLTEWLAIDQIELIRNTFPKVGLADSIDAIEKSIRQQKRPSTMSSIKVIGQTLYEHCCRSESLPSTIALLSSHASDTIRCYAPYLIALNADLKISDKLDQSRSLISDEHFGVREVVWMALRPEIEKNLTASISILSKWTKDIDENIRRFTTESTRPRGVWCKHIEALKEKPEQALPILEPLRSDNSKYVQDSLGNWLNDASKSRPEFVVETCRRWKEESDTAQTQKIVKRALRTLEK